MKKKSTKLQGTLFLLRDLRIKDANFKRLDKKTYKAAAKKCSEAGIPIRTGVEYRNGRPVKLLTILPVRV